MNTKQGVLFVNLGTPYAATPKAISLYLKEFLRDRHVVDVHPLIWLPILHGVIIPKRLKHITQHYQTIWRNNHSPLLYFSQQLCQKFQACHPEFACQLAMTYGEPSIKDALYKLKECQTIQILCLYPQYSTTTTLAAINKIKYVAQSLNLQAKLNYLNDYAEHPAYIQALFEQIKDHIHSKSTPDALVISYHGIPMKYVKKRQDNYLHRCQITTELLSKKVQSHYPNIEIIMAYQSRFGKGKWTEPNLSDILLKLAQEYQSVAVICPGFAVDCLETLYEVNIENRQYFLAAGGQNLTYLPALNDTKQHLHLLSQLIE